MRSREQRPAAGVRQPVRAGEDGHAAGAPPSVAAALRLQRAVGNSAVAGLVADAYPHAAPIRRSTGAEVAGSAVVGSETARDSGVEAFTEDGVTHFADEKPSLGVAAHEAAHLLQQSGATRDMGLGAEGHAAAVEHRVRRGSGATSLLGPAGQAVPAGRLPYTTVPTAKQTPTNWNAGSPVRVSTDGRMAVAQESSYGSHKLWAEAALITDANTALAAAGSVIGLRAGAGTLTGTTRGGQHNLVAVEPANSATATSADAMSIWADCGRSARDVIGVGGGTGKNYDQITGVYHGNGRRFTTSASSPKPMADEIVAQSLGGGDATTGWAAYKKLSKKDRTDFDKKTGINRYAAPGVGSGYTMASGGAEYPGASTWNFHWAGVVMRSGGDAVTLENYATGDPNEINGEWDFQMYGPSNSAGQTFHDQHEATHQHGKEPTTMEVTKR